MPATLIIVL